MEEFFNQGDREAELGFPISPFMDRKKHPLHSTIINCQIGFINVLVKPLLQARGAIYALSRQTRCHVAHAVAPTFLGEVI